MPRDYRSHGNFLLEKLSPRARARMHIHMRYMIIVSFKLEIAHGVRRPASKVIVVSARARNSAFVNLDFSRSTADAPRSPGSNFRGSERSSR